MIEPNVKVMGQAEDKVRVPLCPTDSYDALYISLTGKHLAPGGLTREQFLEYVQRQREQLALEIWNSGPFGRSDTAGHPPMRGSEVAVINAILFGIVLGAVTAAVLLYWEWSDKRRAARVEADAEHLVEKLLAMARAHGPMTDEEREAQRRSFAFGNLKIDRPELTEEEFDRIVSELPKRECPFENTCPKENE